MSTAVQAQASSGAVAPEPTDAGGAGRVASREVPKVAFRLTELAGTPDLVELVTAARDAGHPAMLIERPMPEATSVAGLGAVLDLVSVPGGAVVEDARGRRLLEVAAMATDGPAARLLAVARAWKRVAAAAVPVPRAAATTSGGARPAISSAVAHDAPTSTAKLAPGAAPQVPLAIGGTAFRPDRDPGPPWQGFPSVLFRVPALALMRVRGRTFAIAATLLGDAEAAAETAVQERLDAALDLVALERPAYSAPRARRLTVTPVLDPAAWCEAVRAAAARLGKGEAEKVVLAREVVARADGVVGAGPVLRGLRASYPSCFTYLVPGSDGTALVGATPELLVRRAGAVALCQPMAGSVGRGADDAEDERLAAGLMASAKDRHEHRVVVSAMVDALRPLAAAVDAPEAPMVARLTNIQHLVSTIRAELREPAAGVLELCAALHPTPAVGGAPAPAAMAMLDELEGLERGWYAGAVGWVDGRGDGELAVALRCGLLWEDGARLYAGVGVMEDSDARAELAETELKLSALLGALSV